MTGSRHLLRIDETDLHWVELGEGRPLLLLHGLCDSSRTWSRAAAKLARKRRVIMLDLPGHGLSGRPDASYDLAWYARVLARWIEACGLEDIDLVGHSFGGGVAQQVLLERRDRVRRLALVASGGLGPEVSLALRFLSFAPFVERYGQPFMTLATRIGLATAPDVFDGDDAAWQAWVNGMPGSSRALVRTVRDVIDWRGQTRHFLHRAGEIGELPPVSLFWGARDPIIPIAHGERMHAAMGGVTFTRFEASGHFPHREEPEAFAAALEAFLDADSLTPAHIRTSLAVAARPRTRGFLSRIWHSIAKPWRRRPVPFAPAAPLRPSPADVVDDRAFV